MHLEHFLFFIFNNSINSQKYDHRKDHIAVLATREDVSQYIVSNTPYEVINPTYIAADTHK